MKKNLLLLHGALGAAVQLQRLASDLLDSFEVHCFDLKSHGQRSDGAAFTMEDLTEDVHEYINRNELHHCHIFGYSMGGYIALQLALKHPSEVSAIMTLGTKLNWDEETAAKETALLQPQVMKVKVPQFTEVLHKLHGEHWESLVNNTASMMKHLAIQPLTKDDYQHLHCKVRYSIADHDNMVSLDETVHAYKNTNGASLLVVPDAKHPLDKADHNRLVAEIKNFF